MNPDLWALHRQMLRSRRFEESVTDLWIKGKISGEMHLGIGEEAIAAGVVAHLREGDAMALDHRGTPPLVACGVDLVFLLRELLGDADGLCSGMGGHMHLFSPEHLAASSGIVGAAGPLASGFALAAQHLRPENLAVAFFGEGAMNQGMLMESLNLAIVWKLPLLFVCKDNEWAITTRSSSVTGRDLAGRVQGFGMPVLLVDGTNVEAVWHAAGQGVERARNGEGPTFLLARCPRLEGHFLGDPLLRILRRPIDQIGELAGPLLRSFTSREGATQGERISSFGTVLSMMGQIATGQYINRHDPIDRLRRRLKKEKSRLDEIEKEVDQEIKNVVEIALPKTET
ncbi:MAG: thiamine pyrophosphate-dependent dehydrogenase E1 component subunit alpha [Thermodesulfobacteriota bacterium]|nr:thiamine pyrophosphate-dependent dehydrogenase E1 component subunit alpha [Thermodesulfobacteriota bacterium]